MKRKALVVGLLVVFLSCEELLFEENISSFDVVALSPEDGATLKNSIVTLNWQAVDFATNYQVQIATPTFTEAQQFVLDTIIGDSIAAQTQLQYSLEPNKYEWRIRANNSFSSTGYTTRKFTIEAQIFEEDISEESVQIIAPSNNSVVEVREIRFSWEDVSFAENYKLQIATPNFENPIQVVLDTTTTETSSVYILENGEYEWRVRANNSVSETGFSFANFMVDAETFNEDISNQNVTIIAPSQGTVLGNNEVTFTWEELAFAEDYKLQVATPNFNNPEQVFVDEVLAGTSYSSNLTDGVYEWRVKARNSTSQTSYTTTAFSVMTGANDISNETVVLVAPTNNATLDFNEINFTWNPIDFADAYVLQIATPDFENPIQIVVDTITESTTSIHTLENGEYQWRVKAKNENFETNFSTRSFNVNASVNDISNETVDLLAPSDGVILQNPSVNFNWEAVNGALNYQFQIATPNFDKPIQIVTDITLSETLTTDMLVNGNYEWRVRAMNTTSQTQYSTRSFTLDAEIDFSDRIVIIISPPEGFVTNQSQINLQWQQVEDATLYRIQLLDANTNQLIDEKTTTQTQLVYDFPDGHIIWQVRAETISENTQYTSQHITVDTQVPNTPELLNPLDGALLTSSNINYSWARQSISGTIERDSIFIYSDINLQNLVEKKEVENGSYSSFVPGNGTYFWFMRAYDLAGNKSDDSNVFEFTVNE